jgi:hypothetical protein
LPAAGLTCVMHLREHVCLGDLIYVAVALAAAWAAEGEVLM